jgi:hypothetical protein
VKIVRNDNTSLIYILLKKFKDFKNVFNIIKMGILLDYNRFEHTIKTIGDPSFKPLYNLSRSELEVLKNYLENALAKR